MYSYCRPVLERRHRKSGFELNLLIQEFLNFAPNGFNGRNHFFSAICELVIKYRYCLGYLSQQCYRNTALIAQIIWYFIEGFHYRSQGILLEAEKIIYSLLMKEDLIFL
jgi:hypothetical protein